MAGYSKEFLIDAFMSRYDGVKIGYDLRALAEKCYDTVGKDEFRKYAALDAEALRIYKALKK